MPSFKSSVCVMVTWRFSIFSSSLVFLIGFSGRNNILWKLSLKYQKYSQKVIKDQQKLTKILKKISKTFNIFIVQRENPKNFLGKKKLQKVRKRKKCGTNSCSKSSYNFIQFSISRASLVEFINLAFKPILSAFYFSDIFSLFCILKVKIWNTVWSK